MTLRISSTSSDATEQFGEQLGKRLKGGEVIELSSDLGGGKTTFVRGLARGVGSTDHVSSPTFTISKVYRAGDLTLYHFDFYRLSEAGIMREELAEILEDDKAVVVVEWGGIIEDVLPTQRLKINIAVDGLDERTLTFTCPPRVAHVVDGLSSV